MSGVQSAVSLERPGGIRDAGVVPYVYILGAGHSGSTLLAMLLGMHPRICTIGEVKAPALGRAEHYRCSCGQSITICAFWRAMDREVRARGARLDLAAGATDIRRAPTAYVRFLLRPLYRRRLEGLRSAALALSPTWKTHLRRVQALNVALARAACSITGKDVFVDSSKTGIQLKCLLRHPELDVRVIRLVRDGRGVSLSYRKADGVSIADAAYSWRRSNEEAQAIVSRLPPARWFDLRYEALCEDLERTLRALFEFIGVDPVPSVAQLGAVPQHVLGNNKARLKPTDVRLDENWRRTLTPDDRRTFARIADPLNQRLGYTG